MTKASLQEKNERNFKELCIRAAVVSSGWYTEEKAFSYTKGGLMDWYDKIFDLRLPRPGGGRFLEGLIRRINEREVPGGVFLSAGQVSEAADSILDDFGFDVVYEQTGMAVGKTELAPAKENDPAVRRITSAEGLDDWIRCLEDSFERKRNRDLYARLSETEGVSLWGLFEGEALASTLLILAADGVAGFHLVGTRPAFRKKGYGARITKFAMNRAFSEGAEAVVLLSSKMGEPLYSSLGFTAYGKVKHMKYGGRKAAPA